MNSFYQATPPPPNPPPMARPINFNNPPPPPPAVPLVSPQRTQQMRGEVPALKGQISMAFFTTEIPATATAFFSTNNGKNPKRHLTQPYPMPIARSQLHTDVALAAVDLRDRFPTIVRDIKALADWRDLYKFWDGYDLWVQGAAFCWWVMEQIVKKNVVLEPMIGKEIKKYAVEWTEFHKSEILACHPSTLITTLFTPDEADGLNIMTLRERGELKAALDEERRKLFDATRSLQQQPLHPIREREPLESFPPFINQTPVITQAPLFPLQQVFPVQVQPLPAPGQHGQPTSIQSYNSFMQSQRHLNGNTTSAPGSMHHDEWGMRGHDRRRGMSTDSTHANNNSMKNNGRFGYGSVGYSGRRAISSTSGGSPQKPRKEEPIYVHTGPSHRQGATPKRNFSAPANPRYLHNFNDARISNDLRFDSSYRHQSESSFEPIQAIFKDDPKAYISGKGFCTYWYIDPQNGYTDRDNTRTVYVEHVPKNLFISHGLMDLMTEEGEVEKIHYANDGSNTHGSAFVTFVHAGTVESAINRFDGFPLHTGENLTVQRPKNFGSRYPRDRSNSQLSNTSFGYGFNSHRERRYSDRNNSNSSNNYYRQNAPPSNFQNGAEGPSIEFSELGGHQAASESETGGHQFTLKRGSSQLPVASVAPTTNDLDPKDSNAPDRGDQEQHQEKVNSLNANKENSPIKVSQDEHEHSRVDVDNHVSKPKSQRKKGSKTSRSNTATTTCSAADSDNLDSSKSIVTSDVPKSILPENPDVNGIVATGKDAQVHREQAKDEPCGHMQKKSAPKSSKQHGTAKTTPISTSQPIANSEISASPTDTLASSSTEPCAPASVGSGDNCSSVKQPSIASAKSEVSLSGSTKSFERQTLKDQGQKKPTKRSPKSKRKSNGKNELDDEKKEQKEQKGAFNADSDRTQQCITKKEDANKENTTPVFITNKDGNSKSHRQGQKHAQKHSQGTHSQSVVNENEPPKEPKKEKEDIEPFQPKQDSQQNSNLNNRNENRQGPPKKGNSNNQQYRHERKGSNVSSTAGSSLSVRRSEKPSGGFTDMSGSSTPKKSEEPTKNILEDQTAWPALASTNSPQSSIADGKRPPPCTVAITFRPENVRKNAPGVVVPAVPRLAKKSRPQSDDPLGGPEWPFVKSCRAVW